METLQIMEQLRTPLLLLREGRAEEALAHWRRIQEAAPGHAAVYEVGSVLFEAMDDPKPLVSCLRAALSAWPDRLDMWRLLVSTQRRLEQTESAIRTLTEGLTHHPDSRELWTTLGVLQIETGKAADGQRSLERAIELAPDHPFAMGHLANLHETLHQHDLAVQVANRAQSVDPGNPVAEIVLARVDLRRGNALDARQRLSHLLTRSDLPDRQRASAGLQLAQILDGVGDASAWDAATAGHEAKSTLPEMQHQDRGWLARTAAAALTEWPQARPAADPIPPCEDPPVFLVGFPRSGTTLMEAVLAAAGGFRATDEAGLLETIKRRLAEAVKAEGPLQATVLDRMSAEDVLKVRDGYLNLGRNHFGPRWIDKLPMNLLQLPWIRRLFPNAPIVVALRDPRDCLVSGYFQDLSVNRAMVHFNDPMDLARAYVHTMSVWEAWRADPAIAGIEVRYEDLVSDFEPVARDLLGRCNLEWSEEVASFHLAATRRQIRTPSYHAVAQPIYRRAVGRWRRYQHRIPPEALELLEPLATTFGYAPAMSAV